MTAKGFRRPEPPQAPEDPQLIEQLEEFEDIFRGRSSFIEQCLRLGVIQANGTYRPLAEVQRESDWRGLLLAAIKLWQERVDAKTKAAETPPKRGRVNKNSGDKARGEHRRKADAPSATRPNVWHGARASELVENFIGQHIIYFFVAETTEIDHRLRSPDTLSSEDHKEIVRAVLQRWFVWLHREVKVFLDATILEVLAGRRLPGRVGTDAYNASISAARAFQHGHKTPHQSTPPRAASSPIERENDYLLPARSIIVERLRSASADEFNDLLWAFIRDWESNYWVLASVLDHISEVCSWILRLRVESDALGYHTHLTRLPSGEDNWFFDPDRMRDVVRTVLGIVAPPPTIDDAQKSAASVSRDTASLDDATRILDAREVFFSTCLRSTKEPAGATSPTLRTADEKIASLVDDTIRRAQLERIWWRSLDGIAPGGARAALEFCHGPRADAGVLSPGKKDDERYVALSLETRCPRGVGDTRCVVVFGAGVAGLTAAHELAERGFKVCLSGLDLSPRAQQWARTVRATRSVVGSRP